MPVKPTPCLPWPMQVLQQHAMAGVLKQLQHWATASSAPTTSVQPAPPAACRSDGHNAACLPGEAGGYATALPVAVLSVASSTNTAEAYADLLVALRQQVGTIWCVCSMCVQRSPASLDVCVSIPGHDDTEQHLEPSGAVCRVPCTPPDLLQAHNSPAA